MNNYLIKRDNRFANAIIKKEGELVYFSDTMIAKDRSRPKSYKINPKDIVYVSEVGGGIYAKCEVIEIESIEEFNNLTDALIFFEEKKKKKEIDDLYFFNRILKYHGKILLDNSYSFKIQFYKAKITKIISPYVPLTGELVKKKSSRNAVTTLEKNHIKYIEDSSLWEENNELNENIPSELRFRIYSYFPKMKGLGHIIDVDHFIPKSIGGPGNIIENLVPIGFSLNRNKSGSIPSNLFSESLKLKNIEKKYKNEIQKVVKKCPPVFYRKKDKEFRDISKLAKQILKTINQDLANGTVDIKTIKKFYLSVLKKHHTDWAKIISQYKIN